MNGLGCLGYGHMRKLVQHDTNLVAKLNMLQPTFRPGRFKLTLSF